MKYYADPGGQFMATLRAVAASKDWNLDMPWNGLADEVKHTVLYGTGDQMWDVEWEFTTKGRTGIQSLQAKWEGLCTYIQDEYERRLLLGDNVDNDPRDRAEEDCACLPGHYMRPPRESAEWEWSPPEDRYTFSSQVCSRIC